MGAVLLKILGILGLTTAAGVILLSLFSVKNINIVIQPFSQNNNIRINQTEPNPTPAATPISAPLVVPSATPTPAPQTNPSPVDSSKLAEEPNELNESEGEEVATEIPVEPEPAPAVKKQKTQPAYRRSNPPVEYVSNPEQEYDCDDDSDDIDVEWTPPPPPPRRYYVRQAPVIRSNSYYESQTTITTSNGYNSSSVTVRDYNSRVTVRVETNTIPPH